MSAAELAAAVESRSIPEPTSGCILWLAGMAGGGYGQFRLRGRYWLAHRAAYVAEHGPIPAGLVIDHLCRNRACVNPRHLEPVTTGENNLRGIGPAAENARKTHCKHGHELAGDNLRVDATGRRFCRACCYRTSAESHERRKEAIYRRRRERRAAARAGGAA